MTDIIIQKFIDLSEGRLAAREWVNWFDQNHKIIEPICGRTTFLKMKPKESFSDTRNAYMGQTVVCDWLKSKNISAVLSNTYKEGWEKEFKDFQNAEKQKEKQLQKNIENKFGYLKSVYPKFFNQLTKSYSNSDIIAPGKELSIIKHKEQELSVKLPQDLATFYDNISKLVFEGISIDFEELEIEIIDQDQYLALGEFWIYGDGDKLLYNLENRAISILAHEYRSPKTIKVADTMTELVEKIFVQYLKEYEN